MIRKLTDLRPVLRTHPRSFARAHLSISSPLTSSLCSTPNSRFRFSSRRHLSTRMNQDGTNQPPVDFGHFEPLTAFNIKYAPIHLAKYRSKRTGLSVVVGNHKSPITNGHFVIASEIFDDTGRPHTLEHLVFLGSKSYPFKGVLDQLANRAGSNGTNAWTDTDHTAYTIATAGSDGFLKMLPIYIDHILHPTIKDCGFVTEVHHINGKGEDAGVVYSEMQGRENGSGDLMSLENQRLLYPPSSAYRSETGGLTPALRILDAQQIRDYHSQYYVPHNLCLLIDGAIPLNELFKVLNNQVDPLILAQKPSLGTSTPWSPPNDWTRPFVESSTSKPLSIAKSETKIVEFMEDDESVGEVWISWLGPPPMDYQTNIALKLLGSYLTHSAASPLQKEFVEIPKPYATGIGFYASDRVNYNELSCSLSDVPSKHLSTIGDMLKAKLQKIVKEGIDMERMGLVLRRDKRKLLNSMETSVSSVLADVVIGDFLYGNTEGKELPIAFNDLEDYAVLEKWTSSDWVALLDRYYASPPSLTIIGKPSAAMSARIEKEEKERIAKRKIELGEEKLKDLERRLEEAKKESDIPPPPEMIADFPITDPASLTWVPVETAVNNARGRAITSDQGQLQRHLDGEGVTLPFQAHFSQVKSSFVTTTVLFDTVKLPSRLMPYMALFETALCSVGVKRADGTVLDHEEVVNQLNDFTVSQSSYFSFRGCFSETFVVQLKVELAQFEEAVGWIRDLIAGSIFSKERLSVLLAKQLQELPYEKRQGSSVARAWANRLVFDASKSTSENCSLLYLLENIPSIANELESQPDTVISALEELRTYLLDPSIVRVSVAGDILRLNNPKATLARSFLPISEAQPLAPLSTSAHSLTDLGKNPSKQLIIVPMPAIEGSYSHHYALGVQGWDHPDVPALNLAMSMLNATESYLYKAVRGSGLAYGAYVEVDLESGLVGFNVYRSPNAMLAYEEAGKLVKGLVDGTAELEQALVDGARSSLTYEYARKSETVMAAASTAYLNEALKGVGKNYDQEMLKKLPSVTLDSIRTVIKNYFLPLFSPSTSIGAVAVSAGKADEVQKGFEGLGFTVERKELPMLADGEDGSDEDMSGSGSGSESGDESGSGSGSDDEMESVRGA